MTNHRIASRIRPLLCARQVTATPGVQRLGQDVAMRVLIQRAASAQVSIAGDVVAGLPAPGLLVLIAVTHADTAGSSPNAWCIEIEFGHYVMPG
jgi:hypothetical protein